MTGALAGSMPRTRTERCRACGGEITAHILDPGPGVAEHIASDRHQGWRAGIPMDPLEVLCPDCRMVTIPASRGRCHGCQRTLLRVVAA